ncbi:hypothetical protein [Salinispira pacifica]|uniref:Transcriptional regulator n=1 Tax=Salinispira pacifica TaxID=1307761 RepID=V5WM71_9SPIO|nr:hypothetical protein [Salinispira pacifica]AHC16715.1 Transcriptional regulator [Salinispira pacifica]
MNLNLEADEVFRKTYRQGKRRAIMRSIRKDRFLPGLGPLFRSRLTGGELYRGILDVKIEDIIGSEDRSADFLFDFSPRQLWMHSRWKAVYMFMMQSEAPPPVSLIRFGGKYFVRDGHHRVSVARAMGQNFITAEIREIPVALNLPDDYRSSQSELFLEKLDLHERTGIFEVLPEDYFDVRKTSTWRLLEKEIFEHNRAWFERKHARLPESNKELIQSWTRNLYEDAENYIRSHSLSYLFPESGITDIFVEFVGFWNSFPDPDSIWLKEAYRRFSLEAGKNRRLKDALRTLSSSLNRMFEPAECSYSRFRRFSQIDELVPEFIIPDISRGLMRYIHHQMFIDYAKHLKSTLGRAPYIQEITLDWYRLFYKPLLQQYEASGCRQKFSSFYRRISDEHFETFKSNPEKLEINFEEFC